MAVTALALGIALLAPEGVFALVLVAWSGLGASLGAILVVRLLRWPLSAPTALVMMAAALITVITWQALGYGQDLFQILPGMLAAATVYGTARAYRFVRANT